MKEKWEMHDNGVGLLSHAIINLAIDDYKNARKWLVKMEHEKWMVFFMKRYKKAVVKLRPEYQAEFIEEQHQREIYECQRTIREIKMFFDGEFYRMLTDIDPQSVLRHIDAELDVIIQKEIDSTLQKHCEKGVTYI